MENQFFMKQSLKPHLEELLVMRSCTHLPSLGALSLCMLVFCDLQGHLGRKAKLNHVWKSYVWTQFRKKDPYYKMCILNDR
jgi:hypothetical protein